MKVQLLFWGSLLFLAVGCFDIFTEEQVRLVGNISLISSDNPNDKEYAMVLYEDGINKNVIYDYIKDVVGNDSVLIVKSVNNNCSDIYYKIIHNRGKSPINVISIGSKDYFKQINMIEVIYSFHDDTPCAVHP